MSRTLKPPSYFQWESVEVAGPEVPDLLEDLRTELLRRGLQEDAHLVARAQDNLRCLGCTTRVIDTYDGSWIELQVPNPDFFEQKDAWLQAQAEHDRRMRDLFKTPTLYKSRPKT